MSNYKRKKAKQQVRCTGCTTHRWLGNNVERFDAKTRRDTQPDDPPKHQKLRRGAKPYAIEARSTRTGRPSWLPFEDWEVWRRYRTERDRDEALVALRKGQNGWRHLEYRAS